MSRVRKRAGSVGLEQGVHLHLGWLSWSLGVRRRVLEKTCIPRSLKFGAACSIRTRREISDAICLTGRFGELPL